MAAEHSFPAALAAQARRGTHAMLAARLLSIVCTAVSVTIFARLIPPADFGVWAMTIVPLGVMTIVRELGLVPAVVQARSLAPEQQDAYFWTSVAVSVAAALLLALAAPVLAALYAAPLLQPVLWACCASLVVAGLGLVHAALLRRDLQYEKLVVVEGGGLLCALAAGLAGALLWRNVWALVAGHVASAVWMCASAWALYRWVPGRPRARRPATDLSFSVQVMCSNVMTFVGSNAGLLVGYRFPAADLGFFNRGQTLFGLANFALLTPITEVGFALLCRLKSERAYRDAYVALARRVTVLFIPYAALLPLVSADVVRALLGPAWDAVGPILAWFAPAVFAQAFAALFAQLMMSQGRGRELRAFTAVDLLARTAGAIVGSHFGVVGMAAGFSLASFAVSVPLMFWISGLRGPVRLRDQLAGMWPGLALGVAAAAGAMAAVLAGQALGFQAGWSRLALVAGSAGLAWALACLLLRPAREALLGRGLAHA